MEHFSICWHIFQTVKQQTLINYSNFLVAVAVSFVNRHFRFEIKKYSLLVYSSLLCLQHLNHCMEVQHNYFIHQVYIIHHSCIS